MTDNPSALVFGGSGVLGQAIATALVETGHVVTGTSRSRGGEKGRLWVDPFDPGGAGLDALGGLAPLHAVVWAQGANRSDSVEVFDLAAFEQMLRANCTFVAATMAALLERELIVDGARLCVVSSIWEQLARQEKLSYAVSKAAVGGLVRSAAVDLAPRGILVNAVLPGVVDTPMAAQMLDAEQLARVAGANSFDRLVSVADVAALVCHLCSTANSGVTGQSVSVDLGFSVARRV